KGAHALPHAPQLFGSLVTSDSQPSSCRLLLQSAKPWRQAPSAHLAFTQVDCWFFAGMQIEPQPPQFMLSARTLTSQPLANLLSQSTKPALHMPTTQASCLHAATPLAGAGHGMPHAPQLATCPRSVSQPSLMFLLQSPQ